MVAKRVRGNRWRHMGTEAKMSCKLQPFKPNRLPNTHGSLSSGSSSENHNFSSSYSMPSSESPSFLGFPDEISTARPPRPFTHKHIDHHARAMLRLVKPPRSTDEEQGRALLTPQCPNNGKPVPEDPLRDLALEQEPWTPAACHLDNYIKDALEESAARSSVHLTDVLEESLARSSVHITDVQDILEESLARSSLHITDVQDVLEESLARSSVHITDVQDVLEESVARSSVHITDVQDVLEESLARISVHITDVQDVLEESVARSIHITDAQDVLEESLARNVQDVLEESVARSSVHITDVQDVLEESLARSSVYITDVQDVLEESVAKSIHITDCQDVLEESVARSSVHITDVQDVLEESVARSSVHITDVQDVLEESLARSSVHITDVQDVLEESVARSSVHITDVQDVLEDSVARSSIHGTDNSHIHTKKLQSTEERKIILKLEPALSNASVNLLDSPTQSEEVLHSACDVVLSKCHLKRILLFSDAFSFSFLDKCSKIGEGVYGEVFSCEESCSVIKIIPIEGNQLVNGEPQKTFKEILSEIVITIELSNLRCNQYNTTSAFTEVLRCLCVQGRYPHRLIELWNIYAEKKEGLVTARQPNSVSSGLGAATRLVLYVLNKHYTGGMCAMAGSALFPSKFSGDTDESFEEWLFTFELLAAANGWKEESRPLFLGLSLTGSAQSVYRSLTDKDRTDFDKVCSELKIVFKKPLLPDLKKAAFVSRYRKTNERLTTLAIDLQRLAMEAYPQFNQESRDELVRDRLIQCIEDSDIRVALRRDPAKTVIDLVSRGEMMEAVSEIERAVPVERVVAATTPVAETNITPVLLQQSIQEAVEGALRLVLEEKRPHATSRVSHQEQIDPAQLHRISRDHVASDVEKEDTMAGMCGNIFGKLAIADVDCFLLPTPAFHQALEISAINNPFAIYASGSIRSIKLEFLIDSAATECIIREDVWELVKRPEDQLVSSTISIHDDALNIGGVKVPCHYVKYPNSKKSLFQTHESHVNLAETVTVPARSELFLPHGGIVASEFEELEGCLEPNLQVAAKYGILSACILVTARKNRVPFRLLNTSPDPIVLYKGTSMSHFRPLPEEEKSSPVCFSLTSQTKYRQGAVLFDLTQAKCSEVTRVETIALLNDQLQNGGSKKITTPISFQDAIVTPIVLAAPVWKPAVSPDELRQLQLDDITICPVIKWKEANNRPPHEDAVALGRTTTKSAYEQVRKNLKVGQERQKDVYDRRCSGKAYEVGDKVWLYTPAIREGLTPKLYKPWQGPYVVRKRLSDVTYRIQYTLNPRKRPVVHFNRLKPYSARDPPREEGGPSPVGQIKGEGTRLVTKDDTSLESQATGSNTTSERWQVVEIPQALHNNAVDVNTDEEVRRYPARNRAQTIPFQAGFG
uniref:Integrase p58-like C-terminal domain-containing protein n=1 Tax=Timema monikensis TaxID=170555 RepID=A0A7R9EBF2_9NEOP|nr:unnamed protein product [Timema monikensis]